MAANLALALAEKHKKVLLVDGDLRRPAQHKVFEENGQDRVSFSQVLKGETDWKDAIHYNKRNGIWELFSFALSGNRAKCSGKKGWQNL